MEKINKVDNVKFVVKENIRGKRRVITSGQSLFKILQSYFYGNVICAGEKNKTLETSFQDYFTLDKSLVRGTVVIKYSVNDYLDYAKERNTEKILDVITRTVLSEYFETINLDEITKPYKMPDDIKKILINILNEYVSMILPWVTVSDFSDVTITNSQKYDDGFKYKLNKNINKKEQESSTDVEYYMPSTVNVADDIRSKQFYPDKRYVAKDQMLYYCGRLKKSGTHRNKRAKGDIVNLGLHVLSTNPCIVKAPDEDKLENKLSVYPNIIYEVTDLKKHYIDYISATDLLGELSDYISNLLTYNPATKNLDYNVIHINTVLTQLNDSHLNEIIKTLRDDYAVEVKVIIYSQKNPCVKKTEFVKSQEQLFNELFLSFKSPQRKR